jgi:DNA polymerase-3 subunit delta
MPADLSPEQILDLLKRRRVGKVYLFYGPGEFLIEKVLSEIRETLIPESARDFNLQIFYGGEVINPVDITDMARSVPFLSPNRLIIIRRTENIPATALESFIPYIDNPVPSTCLIFVSGKTDFRKEFYKKIRGAGGAVHFKPLYDREVMPWLRRFAADLGLNITEEGRVYLQGIVGNRLRDLYTEMEKLYLRYGSQTVGQTEIKELAITSRIYTIFELMDEISLRRHAGSLSVLNRYLEGEGRDAVFGIIGMLNRQIRLIMQAKSITDKGGKSADVVRKLKVQPFLVNKILEQARNWHINDLEHALHLLHRADRQLKSGAQPRLTLEHLLLSL